MLPTTALPTTSPSVAAKRAVIYLRVSSDAQVERGFTDEGYSIPAQREACERKAADLGATVVRTYIDLAKTAKTQSRPQFQQMVADIERDRNVDIAIVHKLNRFARNAMDDAVIAWRLQQAGAQLVSVVEPIDGTPAGKLSHRLFAAIAEYENENLAAEIRKGQIQKHRAGGTPFTAPVGYKHTPIEFEGRLINAIVIDEERGPLVQLAFDLYGTGKFSITRLRDVMEAHGLTSRPSRKRTSRPLSRAGIHTMLRNPYYIGTVVYMGNAVEGRHPKLIDPETFGQVQAQLDAQRAAGERSRTHQHYLKGTLTCGVCGGRLIYGKHRGKGGVYEYFSCVRRRARNGGSCDSGHYRVEQVELEVAALYWPLRLSPREVEAIRSEIKATAEKQVTSINKAATRHRRRLEALEQKQAKLIEWRYAGEVSATVMKRQTELIEAEQNTLNQLLSRSETEFQEIDEALGEALRLTERPLEFYLGADDLGRRMLNQAFFQRILVGPTGDLDGAVLQPLYARILGPRLFRQDSPDLAPDGPTSGQGQPNPGLFFFGPGFDCDQNGAPGEIRTPDLRFRSFTLEVGMHVVRGDSVRLGEARRGHICRAWDMVRDMVLLAGEIESSLSGLARSRRQLQPLVGRARLSLGEVYALALRLPDAGPVASRQVEEGGITNDPRRVTSWFGAARRPAEAMPL